MDEHCNSYNHIEVVCTLHCQILYHNYQLSQYNVTELFWLTAFIRNNAFWHPNVFCSMLQPWSKPRSMIILMHLAFYEKAYLKSTYSYKANEKNSRSASQLKKQSLWSCCCLFMCKFILPSSCITCWVSSSLYALSQFVQFTCILSSSTKSLWRETREIYNMQN